MSEIAQTGYLSLAPQSGKGVAASPDGTLSLKLTSNTLSGNAELLDDDDEIGGGRHADASAAMLGGFTVGGQIEGLFRAKIIGYLLMAAGFQPAAPVQDAATGAYTHTFTPGAFTYLTIITRWGSTAAVRKFVDCLVNEFSISVDAGGKVTWTASILGTQETYGVSGVTPTFETSPVCAWDASAVSLDGLGTYRFESTELTINNNLSDDEWVIGSRFLDDVTPGNQEVGMTGTVKVGGNNPAVTDLYRAAVFGSKTATGPQDSSPYHTAAGLSFLSPKKIGTSTTKRFGLIATIADMVLAGFPLEASGSDRLTVDLEGRAYKGASPILSIDLQNDRSTVYA